MWVYISMPTNNTISVVKLGKFIDTHINNFIKQMYFVILLTYSEERWQINMILYRGNDDDNYEMLIGHFFNNYSCPRLIKRAKALNKINLL